MATPGNPRTSTTRFELGNGQAGILHGHVAQGNETTGVLGDDLGQTIVDRLGDPVRDGPIRRVVHEGRGERQRHHVQAGVGHVLGRVGDIGMRGVEPQVVAEAGLSVRVVRPSSVARVPAIGQWPPSTASTNDRGTWCQWMSARTEGLPSPIQSETGPGSVCCRLAVTLHPALGGTIFVEVVTVNSLWSRPGRQTERPRTDGERDRERRHQCPGPPCQRCHPRLDHRGQDPHGHRPRHPSAGASLAGE